MSNPFNTLCKCMDLTKKHGLLIFNNLDDCDSSDISLPIKVISHITSMASKGSLFDLTRVEVVKPAEELYLTKEGFVEPFDSCFYYFKQKFNDFRF